MKTFPAFLLLSAFLVFPAAAAPVELGSVKLRDGRLLEKVKVMKVEPDGLRIEHASGVGKVRLEDLPSDLSQRFSLDEATASAWRLQEKQRLDGLDDAKRRAQVRLVTEATKADQDRQAQAARLSLFDQAKASDVNYASLDDQLLQLITLWREAGREDLAARFEEDRALFKQQEIARPADRRDAENQELARRVNQLQNDLTEANNRPAPVSTTVVVDSDPFADSYRRSNYYNPYYNSSYGNYYPRYSNYYYVPPAYVNRPSTYCPPTVNRPSPYRPPVVTHTPYCPPTTRIIPATPYSPATVVRTPVRYPTTSVRPYQTPAVRVNPVMRPPAVVQRPAAYRPASRPAGPAPQRGLQQRR